MHLIKPSIFRDHRGGKLQSVPYRNPEYHCTIFSLISPLLGLNVTILVCVDKLFLKLYSASNAPYYTPNKAYVTSGKSIPYNSVCYSLLHTIVYNFSNTSFQVLYCIFLFEAINRQTKKNTTNLNEPK